MRLTLSQIAELTGGTLRGDGSTVIQGAAGLGEATEKDISFLGNPKYAAQLQTTRAGALLVPPDTDTFGRPAVVHKNPPYGWARVLELLEKERQRHPSGIHPTAVIAKTAVLGRDVAIGAYSVIDENAVIGDETVIYPHCFIGADTRIGKNGLIYPHVTLRERVIVGDRCVFQPGVVIGGDGYGFTLHQGRHYKIPQVGGVEIGDDVEIQANTTIDRAATGMTRIGRGTKIDNLVQIAHNVETGENCLIVALTGVAGSVKLGNYVTLAAQVGVAGHLTVGDGVICGGKGGITHNTKPNEVVWGLPARPIKEELKIQAALQRLPKILEEWKKLKKKMGIEI
ncbi:MAG: UDP-3-O-(3-hydroxymyristoyl)glucosamine N-acyltransferase [Elusimicrobia bacterium]|nr:UDP-3-O-(3-hydroxymyristoyl)glucosamine N-acyltransferase [Elusimicrobiota bacterium]